jgi:hypothetical protein
MGSQGSTLWPPASKDSEGYYRPRMVYSCVVRGIDQLEFLFTGKAAELLITLDEKNGHDLHLDGV